MGVHISYEAGQEDTGAPAAATRATTAGTGTGSTVAAGAVRPVPRPAHALGGQPDGLHREGAHGALHSVQRGTRVHQCTEQHVAAGACEALEPRQRAAPRLSRSLMPFGAPQPVPQPRLGPLQTRRGARHQHEFHLRGIRVQVRVGAEADRGVLAPELPRIIAIRSSVVSRVISVRRIGTRGTGSVRPRNMARISAGTPAARRRGAAGTPGPRRSRPPAARRRSGRWRRRRRSACPPMRCPEGPLRHVVVDVHVRKRLPQRRRG